MLIKTIGKNGITLGLFAILTTGVVVATYALTKKPIAEKQKEVLLNSLAQVMPLERYDNDILTTTKRIRSELLGTKRPTNAYIATQQGKASGVILPIVAPEGYGGSIRLLVGIDADGNVLGVRVIGPHSETPGLGDQIEIKKSDWIKSFDGKSLSNPDTQGWQVKKDGGEFDAFTGATITPRAVISAVHSGLQYFSDNKAELFISIDKAQDSTPPTSR